MDTIDLIIMIFAIAFGVFALMASILNWDFYFEHPRAKFFVKILTRTGARIFYAILGLFLMGLGVYTILTETGVM